METLIRPPARVGSSTTSLMIAMVALVVMIATSKCHDKWTRSCIPGVTSSALDPFCGSHLLYEVKTAPAFLGIIISPPTRHRNIKCVLYGRPCKVLNPQSPELGGISIGVIFGAVI